MRDEKNTILIQVSHAELKKMMLDRADYHDQRAAEKEPHIAKLREADDAVRGKKPDGGTRQLQGLPGVAEAENVVSQFGAMLSNMQQGYRANIGDQADALEADVRDHRARAKALRFVAEHLCGSVFEFRVPGIEQLRWPVI